MTLAPVIKQAIRIRAFERKLLELFAEDAVSGTVHTCIGQELCATALAPHLDIGRDAFVATHRGHGHYLALGGPPDALLAELMGREGALCRGRGGSQHLCRRGYISSGVQGGTPPLAVGLGWARKLSGTDAIAVAQVGDGTFGEGALYEAMTFAALWSVPVLFLVEYNGIAMTTDVATTTPGDLEKRIAGFGLEYDRRSDMDPESLHAHMGEVVSRVRSGQPFMQVIDTRRLAAHSKGDDPRAPELIAALKARDPVQKVLDSDPEAAALMERCAKEVAQLASEVRERPLIPFEEGPVLPRPSPGDHAGSERPVDNARIVQRLNAELHRMMDKDPSIVVIGEDLADPYGGAFKVTRGLSVAHPERLFNTPISEAAIVGVSNGLALGGARPIAEIMFADFAFLAADQLINHAAKFHYTYAGQVTCPLTLRLVSGGGRGYGPTHSQCTELAFCGIPGLRVLALSHRHAPEQLLRAAVYDDAPTVLVEHKALYGLFPPQEPPIDLTQCAAPAEAGEPLPEYAPLCFAPVDGEPADVTIVTYGGTAPIVEESMRELILQDELRFEYIILTQLWPLHAGPIVASAHRTRRLLIVEESVATFGLSAALAAAVAKSPGPQVAVGSVGAAHIPIPCARHQESSTLPTVHSIAEKVRSMTRSA